MASIFDRLVSGSLWLTGARIILNILGVISTVVLARLLLPEDFGLVAIASAVVAVMSVITELSLAQALVYRRDVNDQHLHTVWTMSVIRAVILAGALALAATPIADFYGDARLSDIMMVLALTILLSGFDNPRLVLMTKSLQFRPEFILTISDRLVSLVVAIVIAWVWKSYWALVLGVLAGKIVSLTISYILYPYLPKITLRHARELWSYSIWLTLSQGVYTLNQKVDQLLVGNFLGTATLGFYAVGNKLAVLPTREAATPIAKTLFPAFSAIGEDPDRLRRAYERAQNAMVFLTLPAGVGFALIAEPVVLLAMGDKWLPAVPIIQAMACLFAVQNFGQMVRPLAMSTGLTRRLFTRDVFMLFLRLPAIIVGMIFWGLTGLIVARVIVGLIFMLVNINLSARIVALPARQQIFGNSRTILSVLVMVACVLLAQAWLREAGFGNGTLIGVSIPLGGLIYAATDYVIWRLSGRPAGPEHELIRIWEKRRKK